MPPIDISILINWVVSGFVGLVFGIISAWVTHRYEKKKDDIAWEREKEKLKLQFENETKLLELQYQQKMRDFEKQLLEQKQENIRKELLRGLDDPDKEIKKLSSLTNLPTYGIVHAGSATHTDFDEDKIDSNHYDISPVGTYTSNKIWTKIASTKVGWVRINGENMNAALPVSIENGNFLLVSFEQEIKHLINDDIALISSANDDESNLSIRRYKESSKLFVSESTISNTSIPVNGIKLVGIALCVAKRR